MNSHAEQSWAGSTVMKLARHGFCLGVSGLFLALPASADPWALCETEQGLCLFTAPSISIGDACSCFGDPGSIPEPPSAASGMGDACLVGQNLCEIPEPQELNAACSCLDREGKVIKGPTPADILNAPDN